MPTIGRRLRDVLLEFLEQVVALFLDLFIVEVSEVVELITQRLALNETLRRKRRGTRSHDAKWLMDSKRHRSGLQASYVPWEGERRKPCPAQSTINLTWIPSCRPELLRMPVADQSARRLIPDPRAQIPSPVLESAYYHAGKALKVC